MNQDLGFDDESHNKSNNKSDEESDDESDGQPNDEYDDKSDNESNSKEFDEEFDEESDNKSDDKSGKVSDKVSDKSPARARFIPACSTTYAREKLVRILNGEVVVPKQQWGIDRIFTTLTYHRKDKWLSSSYRKYKKFAFNTLLRESDKTSTSGRLSGTLTQKD